MDRKLVPGEPVTFSRNSIRKIDNIVMYVQQIYSDSFIFKRKQTINLKRTLEATLRGCGVPLAW